MKLEQEHAGDQTRNVQTDCRLTEVTVLGGIQNIWRDTGYRGKFLKRMIARIRGHEFNSDMNLRCFKKRIHI